ncbi:MAG: phosphopentomutase [Gemmatimonadaceae bacterium]|nr:phosphopentomutase [Gemmatimonadaceae bacterium]
MTSPTTRRAALIVLDGVGCGEAPDAAHYGDAGSDTLRHVLAASPALRLPAFERLGLGHLGALPNVPPAPEPEGAVLRCTPRSAGKDSTTGHWELCGVVLERPFPTYPHGFPAEVIDAFARATGRAVLGNRVASGTAILDELAAEHVRTGAWIVYTSADSVFQVAAHEDVVPLDELYAACEHARAMLAPPHDVSRVIARPFVGHAGAWRRTTNRRDYSLAPPAGTLLDALAAAGIARTGVGKVDDLFAGRAITSTHTASNAEGIVFVQRWLESRTPGLLFANLVDFDQLFGHRNDVAGFAGALAQFDAALPALLQALGPDTLLLLTADHGNDPTTPSTDHARECVPLLVAGNGVRRGALPPRATFADVGATLADWFGLDWRGAGTSFLAELVAP